MYTVLMQVPSVIPIGFVLSFNFDFDKDFSCTEDQLFLSIAIQDEFGSIRSAVRSVR